MTVGVEEETRLADRVFETLRSARKASSFRELTDVFIPALRHIGFPYFTLSEAKSLPNNLSLTPLFGRPDTAWVDAYMRERLAGVDPRLRHMLGSAEPAFLSELIFAGGSSEDRGFLERFGTYGHTDCYIWPVHLPEGGVRAVLMLSDASHLPYDAKVAVEALASGFHGAGAKLMRRLEDAKGISGPTLRPRQLECLYWARQGKSSADIGHILGLSPRTVDEHIAHACAALGVRTRIQAVARAVVLGLI